MTWVVQENPDGTVTIEKSIYEELRRKAGEYQKLVNVIAEMISNNLRERSGEDEFGRSV